MVRLASIKTQSLEANPACVEPFEHLIKDAIPKIVESSANDPDAETRKASISFLKVLITQGRWFPLLVYTLSSFFATEPFRGSLQIAIHNNITALLEVNAPLQRVELIELYHTLFANQSVDDSQINLEILARSSVYDEDERVRWAGAKALVNLADKREWPQQFVTARNSWRPG